jgi:ABC-type glycerol-3-phosphate transport system substrate-binding protein
MKPKILFMLFLCAAALSACKGDPVKTPGNPAAENDSFADSGSEPQNYLDALPAENFGGYAFTIIGRESEAAFIVNFPEETETGEPVNDALYRRDKLIEERFGIKIEHITFPGVAEVSEKVGRSVAAQDNAYDMAIDSLANGLNTVAAKGVLRDLNSIDYLKLDSDWWCRSLYEDMQVNGRIFYTMSPISPLYYKTPVVFLYNKMLMREMDLGDMNQFVQNNEWTYGKLAEILKDQNRDLDGDGELNAADDFFGIAGDFLAGTALPFALGQKMIVRDSDAYFKLNYESEAMIDAVRLSADILRDKSVSYNANTNYVQYGEVKPFKENRLLCMIVPVGFITVHLRDMESDFGILPVPKLDASQENFYVYGVPHISAGVGVPAYCDNPGRTGLIMEAMSHLSHETVRPAVYDNTLQQKGARDEESIAMLDLIFSNIYFDLNEIQNFGGSCDLMRECTFFGTGDFVSGYEKIKAKAEKEIKELVDAYLALD